MAADLADLGIDAVMDESPKVMKILLNVCGLINRTGGEWFVYDLAVALNKRGHSVIVYAPIMSDEMVEPLRFLSIACVTDLNQVAAAPDIIIGNMQTETVLCLAQFPGVPAISICHDRSALHGQPPMFSRVRQYVAVDANCAERLTLGNGIPESKVMIIQNGIDLARFKPRSALPERPQRAAIFSNYATESPDTRTIRAVCAELDIELSVIGAGVENQALAPEEILGNFDLVFAKARCAMEAIVTGCAVILLNEGMGMAGMVNPANMAHQHRWNFGRKLLQQQIDAAALRLAILEYAPEKAAIVSAYLRQHGSLDATVSACENLAKSIVEYAEFLPPIDLAQENREFARHAYNVVRSLGATSDGIEAKMMAERQLQTLEHLRTIQHQLAKIIAGIAHFESEEVRNLQGIGGYLWQQIVESDLAAATVGNVASSRKTAFVMHFRPRLKETV